jgi:outer membrane biosynthesis protein TonB
MKCLIALTSAFFVGLTSSADAQSVGSATTEKATASDSETTYWIAHQKADPRFVTSIERMGPCKIPGPPLSTEAIRIPWQIYPQEAVQNHEEGRVIMQLIFDADWCVRKAAIVESTKFWRLDEVSLKWAMTIKWSPKKTLLTGDGEPTVTIPIAWGRRPR